jgi:GNAT superfamily N-acetyltransferase
LIVSVTKFGSNSIVVIPKFCFCSSTLFLAFEPLTSNHDRSELKSGVEYLDRYFRTQAGQDAQRNMAAPFVLVLPNEMIAGYYVISAVSVQLGELPAQTVRNVPRYPLVPATLLGRLAVDRHHQGKGCGRFLLADAPYRAARSAHASFAVIVDAKNENARRFYERESFLPFPDQPMKLFRPMGDIRRLFD